MKRLAGWLLLAFGIGALAGCTHDSPPNAWIQGDSQQRWTTVERHLRGLDVAMVEIGYRYQELYWAGGDANWAYANYQVTKMGRALDDALERRPKRRPSSEALFRGPLEEMTRVVTAEERQGFEDAFATLTGGCNACHAAEGFASFVVEKPTVRPSPIRALR